MRKGNNISSIKNEEQYKTLREQSYNKDKSASIANTPNADQKGGEAKDYEDRTKAGLYQRSKKNSHRRPIKK